jgi:hypothetical protein
MSKKEKKELKKSYKVAESLLVHIAALELYYISILH